jgi:L-lactate dehydrogenase complex protein LldE
MTVGLFIPCYVNQLYPSAAIATLQLLQKLGVNVVYPSKQTCCGQPMANSGFEYLSEDCDKLFIENFAEFDYVVAPSASCTLHIKDHLHSEEKPEQAALLRSKIYELTEFLTDILKVDKLDARFPYKVGLHQSCHGLRGLHLAKMSELVGPPFSKLQYLLNMVDGLELVTLNRPDDCCGFGGTFCVAEEAISVKMGKDRVKDHTDHGAEYITSADLSCLMHLEGIIHRDQNEVKVLHIAEILNSSL